MTAFFTGAHERRPSTCGGATVGMIGEYARLTAAEFERAVGDPDWAYERVRELSEQEWDAGLPWDQARCYDTDKMWHALDFLLRRVGFPVDVVFGEEEIPGADDWSYGPPRCLTPDQVRTAAEAFAATPPPGSPRVSPRPTWQRRTSTRRSSGSAVSRWTR